MARALRLEFPSVLYYITLRGDRQAAIYDPEKTWSVPYWILKFVDYDFNTEDVTLDLLKEAEF